MCVVSRSNTPIVNDADTAWPSCAFLPADRQPRGSETVDRRALWHLNPESEVLFGKYRANCGGALLTEHLLGTRDRHGP